MFSLFATWGASDAARTSHHPRVHNKSWTVAQPLDISNITYDRVVAVVDSDMNAHTLRALLTLADRQVVIVGQVTRIPNLIPLTLHAQPFCLVVMGRTNRDGVTVVQERGHARRVLMRGTQVVAAHRGKFTTTARWTRQTRIFGDGEECTSGYIPTPHPIGNATQHPSWTERYAVGDLERPLGTFQSNALMSDAVVPTAGGPPQSNFGDATEEKLAELPVDVAQQTQQAELRRQQAEREQQWIPDNVETAVVPVQWMELPDFVNVARDLDVSMHVLVGVVHRVHSPNLDQDLLELLQV